MTSSVAVADTAAAALQFGFSCNTAALAAPGGLLEDFPRGKRRDCR